MPFKPSREMANTGVYIYIHIHITSVAPMSTSIRDKHCYHMRTKLTHITQLKYCYELNNVSKNDISHIGARV
jgi:hypothetical protein